MKSSRILRLTKWARNGAIFGLTIALLDFTGWRGQNYVPWDSSSGIAINMSYILGSVLGAAFLFLIAAFVANLVAKD